MEPLDLTTSPVAPVVPWLETAEGQAFMFKGRASLAAKKAVAMGEISRVAKNGMNTEQKYRFVSAEDLYDEVRQALAKAGIGLSVEQHEPIVEPIMAIGNGGKEYQKGRKMQLPLTFTLTCSDTGWSETLHARGECYEYGDKAISKCITAGTKYFIRSLFLVSTGDDADQESPTEEQPVAQQQQVDSRSANGKPKSEGTNGNGSVNAHPGALYIAKLGLKKPQVDAFKAACAEHGWDHKETAKDISESEAAKNITDYDGLMAAVRDLAGKGEPSANA